MIDRDNEAAFKVAGEIGYEYCLRVTGTVRKRIAANDKLRTGTVELVAATVEVLNAAKDPPFALHENPNEDMRMTYRHLDLRRPEMQQMMREAGYGSVNWIPYTFGIAGLYVGTRQ